MTQQSVDLWIMLKKKKSTNTFKIGESTVTFVSSNAEWVISLHDDLP